MSVLDGEGHVTRRVNTPLPLTPSTSFLPELLITSLCPTPLLLPLAWVVSHRLVEAGRRGTGFPGAAPDV